VTRSVRVTPVLPVFNGPSFAGTEGDHVKASGAERAPVGCLWYEAHPSKASFFKARISRASLRKASSVKLYLVDLPTKATMGSRIKAVRQKTGLTQAEFGQRLDGVAWMQISRYERGQTSTPCQRLIGTTTRL
jgi:hypothetical protein